MPLVKYYPGDTFFHKLDPRVKIVWMFLLFILAFIFNHPLHLGIILLSVILLWEYVGIPFREIGAIAKALIIISAVTFIFQLLFYPGTHEIFVIPIPTWIPYFGGAIVATKEGVVNGVAMVLRLFIIVMSMPTITMTTSIERLMVGLIEMGIPYTIVFAFTTALNLVPALESEVRMIVDAQRARAYTALEKGGLREKLRAYIPLIVPLMVNSMRRGRQLEIAMESRAFGAYKRRTYLIELKMRLSDYLFLTAILSVLILCVFLRISLGFGKL